MTHRDFASIPLAFAAAANPIWLPTAEQISFWLSVGLQVGGLILIAVQVRHYWRMK